MCEMRGKEKISMKGGGGLRGKGTSNLFGWL